MPPSTSSSPGQARAFQAVLIRSSDGVGFVEGEPPVHAVFVLAASPQERNFYLKALVAIAEIAQNADFDRKWLAARRAESLREVVLASSWCPANYAIGFERFMQITVFVLMIIVVMLTVLSGASHLRKNWGFFFGQGAT